MAPDAHADNETSVPPRKRTSSAQRLLDFLLKIKSSGGAAPFRVIPSVMNHEIDGPSVDSGWSYAECTAIVGKMLADLELELNSTSLSEEEIRYHMMCKSSITSALAPIKMTQPWDQARSAIGETVISKLEGAVVVLRRTVSEEMLAASDLNQLRTSIEDALDTLRESALPEQLRGFVAMHLIRIRTALDEYEYRGLVGLQDAVAGYTGSLAAISVDGVREQTTAPQKRKLADVLTIANGLVTLAHGAVLVWPALHTGASFIAGLL